MADRHASADTDPGAVGTPVGREHVRRLGELALQLRVPAEQVEALRVGLIAAPLIGQRTVVPGGASVTVTFGTAQAAAASIDSAAVWAASYQSPAGSGSAGQQPGTLITIDVDYRGDDLDAVAQQWNTDRDGVVERHCGQEWRVAFVGFAPGFAYLRGDGSTAAVSRASTPRVRVPPGAVALGGEFSAVYPRASPGGWQLIGRTDATVWDLSSPEPALLTPGTRVRFIPTRERLSVPEPARSASAVPGPALRGVTVHAAGVQTLIEDLGRPGHADLGVTTSGAADRAAAKHANRLVGNPIDAAVIEHAGGGLRLCADADQVLAVSGAQAQVTISSELRDRDAPHASPFPLWAGEVLEVQPPERGLRVVIAVRGGLAAPRTLGSAATDTLSGLGPAPLAPGDQVPVGIAPRAAVSWPSVPLELPTAQTVLDVLPGPDDDWFPASSHARFVSQAWSVSSESNRVGVRLTGQPLPRRTGELDSHALTVGAIQIPPSGQPVIFLADHPTTGGYPVIGVVAPHHLHVVAQLTGGATVRFRTIAHRRSY